MVVYRGRYISLIFTLTEKSAQLKEGTTSRVWNPHNMEVNPSNILAKINNMERVIVRIVLIFQRINMTNRDHSIHLVRE